MELGSGTRTGTGKPRLRKSWWWTAALAVSATCATALTPATAVEHDAPAESTTRAQGAPVGHSNVSPPRIRWYDACPKGWKMPQGWKCGAMTTPLDHARPGKGTVELAVAKLPARKPERRVGSLLTNPGGPGGSGIADAANGNWQRYFTGKMRERFDLVAYDPRGVAHSRPALNCAQQDDADDYPPHPRTAREMLAELRKKDKSGAGCAKKAGRLVPHMSTVDNVRDLERLRQAVKDRKLNFLGVSYGTTIGAVYANLYPHRVRSMILHGIVDARTQMNNTAAFSITQAQGYAHALRARLHACDKTSKQRCAFTGNAEAKFNRLAAHLGNTHRPRPASRKQWDELLYYASAFIGNEDELGTRAAAQKLQHLYESTFGSRRPNSRAAQAAQVPTNEEDVLAATNCLDTPPLPKRHRHWLTWFRQARAQAPLFGPGEVIEKKYCRDWPSKFRAAAPRHTGPWNRARVPILLINQRWDQSTPLRWARNMRQAMGQRGLVIIHGHWHGVPTNCSRAKSEAYLLHRTAPTGEEVCPDGDSKPFG
ncbi:alpha/beta fold hydrolase [Streptomyces sp. CA-250714]|uniref:alpha/beta fold hydrolase n=1 Tax=Streptomyces sp. CA-250714 TaxID=3240060 RepID=UPI003D8B7190